MVIVGFSVLVGIISALNSRKGFLFFRNAKSTNIGGKKLRKSGSIKSQINTLDNIIKLDLDISIFKEDIRDLNDLIDSILFL